MFMALHLIAQVIVGRSSVRAWGRCCISRYTLRLLIMDQYGS